MFFFPGCLYSGCLVDEASHGTFAPEVPARSNQHLDTQEAEHMTHVRRSFKFSPASTLSQAGAQQPSSI